MGARVLNRSHFSLMIDQADAPPVRQRDAENGTGRELGQRDEGKKGQRD